MAAFQAAASSFLGARLTKKAPKRSTNKGAATCKALAVDTSAIKKVKKAVVSGVVGLAAMAGINLQAAQAFDKQPAAFNIDQPYEYYQPSNAERASTSARYARAPSVKVDVEEQQSILMPIALTVGAFTGGISLLRPKELGEDPMLKAAYPDGKKIVISEEDEPTFEKFVETAGFKNNVLDAQELVPGPMFRAAYPDGDGVEDGAKIIEEVWAKQGEMEDGEVWFYEAEKLRMAEELTAYEVQDAYQSFKSEL